MRMTVNAIVAQVGTLLGDGSGLSRADRLTEAFRGILDRTIPLAEHRKKIRSRRGVAFYLAVGDVKDESLVLDARIAGRKCGEIRLGKKKDRRFFPANFDELWAPSTSSRFDSRPPPKQLAWSDARVRTYLEAAANRIQEIANTGKRINEAAVESAFLAELRVSKKGDKQHYLRQHQPVYLGGVPFQFPLPISACKELRVANGNAAGHSDVLARRAGRRLRVFEVKQPGASDADHALEQAVSYAAALQLLLERSRDVYYRMLGYSSTHPPLRLDAVALVDEGSLETVREAATILSSDNAHFDLYVMLYRLGGTDGRQLIITKDEKLGARRANYPT